MTEANPPCLDASASARVDKMDAEGRPIVADGVEVGRILLYSDHTEAIPAANKAAFHTSSPKDVQFCPFSDASCGDSNGRGGVSVVYRRQWLPSEWISDQAIGHPNGAFLKQAWAYAQTVGVNALEAVGLLESLHAANKSIARDLQVLKDHDCTVTVKCTTDSREALRYIAPRKNERAKLLPAGLSKRIIHEIQMLHGHGIKVMVELHWCRRNEVPQLCIADQLAGMARKSLKGYSNAEEELWSKTIKSDMADEIEMIISRPLLPANPRKVSKSKASDPPTAPPQAPAPQEDSERMSNARKRRMKKRRAREVAQTTTTTSADGSDAYAQLPLPPIPPPMKPGSNAYMQAENSTKAATPSHEKAVLESQKGEHVAEESPTVEESPTAQEPAPAETKKRKRKDEDGGEQPNKRAKLSHGREEEEEETKNAAEETGSGAPQAGGPQHTYMMPTPGEMDPEIRARHDVQGPPARMVVLSTMDWRQERRMAFSKML